MSPALLNDGECLCTRPVESSHLTCHQITMQQIKYMQIQCYMHTAQEWRKSTPNARRMITGVSKICT